MAASATDRTIWQTNRLSAIKGPHTKTPPQWVAFVGIYLPAGQQAITYQ